MTTQFVIHLNFTDTCRIICIQQFFEVIPQFNLAWLIASQKAFPIQHAISDKYEPQGVPAGKQLSIWLIMVAKFTETFTWWPGVPFKDIKHTEVILNAFSTRRSNVNLQELQGYKWAVGDADVPGAPGVMGVVAGEARGADDGRRHGALCVWALFAW